MKRLVKTLRPDGKDGVYMNEELYYSLQVFFIAAVTDKPGLTLCQIIGLAEKTLPVKLLAGIGYYMIHIKYDLLARDVIKQKSTGPKIGLPMISLKQKVKIKHSMSSMADGDMGRPLTVLSCR
jgi:hypothetical protein